MASSCGGQAFCWCGKPAKFGGLNSRTKNADFEYWCGESGCNARGAPDVDVKPLADNGAHEYCECKWPASREGTLP